MPRRATLWNPALAAIGRLAAAALCACGGSDSQDSKASKDPSPPAATPPAVPPSPTPAPAPVGGLVAQAQAETASVHLRTFALTISVFVVERGRLPASLAELTLSDAASGGVPPLEKVPLDPWGGAYEYRVLDAAKRDWIVRSAGPDGRFATPDDVVGKP